MHTNFVAMSLIVLSIPIFFVLICIEVIYDLIAKRGLYRLNDAVANISCGIFEQVTGVFLKVLVFGAYVATYEAFRLFEVPTTWWSVTILFVAIDFLYYWGHRHSHTVNLFWTGHVVHHQSEDYNLSVALRQGALQKLFIGWYYLPLALLGFSPEWFLIIGALQTLYQFWIHTESINRLGWFGYLFNTPSHHRVHHGRDPKYIDKNHGGTLIIWDRLFGTFQAEEERPTYGITTPTNTFDAVESHWHPWQNMREDMKLISGFGNKLRYLWKPPGWLPEQDGGFRPPKAVDKATYQKFDYPVPIALNWYLLVGYLLTIGIAALFLFTAGSMTLELQAGYALLIVISIFVQGQLFNARRWALALEYLRLSSIVGVALLLPEVLPFGPEVGWIHVSIASIFGLSILWLLLIQRNWKTANA